MHFKIINWQNENNNNSNNSENKVSCNNSISNTIINKKWNQQKIADSQVSTTKAKNYNKTILINIKTTTVAETTIIITTTIIIILVDKQRLNHKCDKNNEICMVIIII